GPPPGSPPGPRRRTPASQPRQDPRRPRRAPRRGPQVGPDQAGRVDGAGGRAVGPAARTRARRGGALARAQPGPRRPARAAAPRPPDRRRARARLQPRSRLNIVFVAVWRNHMSEETPGPAARAVGDSLGRVPAPVIFLDIDGVMNNTGE